MRWRRARAAAEPKCDFFNCDRYATDRYSVDMGKLVFSRCNIHRFSEDEWAAIQRRNHDASRTVYRPARDAETRGGAA